MPDKTDAETSNVAANEPRQRFRHSRRLGMMRSLMINVTLIVVPLLVYFVVVIQHSSAYADERSLRALQEIATQIDNRVDALKSRLVYWSGREYKRICSSSSGECRDPDSNVIEACQRPANAALGVITIAYNGRDPRFLMVDCDPESWKKNGDKGPSFAEITFSKVIDNTEALKELPLIVVASDNGEVYTQLMRNRSKDLKPPAHAEVREEPTVANLREVLVAAEKRAANDLEGKGEGSNPAKAKSADNPQVSNQLGLPVALDTRIAGTPYRAYVLPYPLQTMCEFVSDASKNGGRVQCANEQKTIYLVGLKKGGMVATAASSLSPVLLLGALLSLISACLLWPFLRHALLEPNDAVTWRQVRILCVAFLVLTALAVLSVRASELGYFMTKRMNQALGEVAKEIDCQMSKRVVTELIELDRIVGNKTSDKSLTACNDDDPKVIKMPPSAVERLFQTNDEGKVPAVGGRTYDAIKKEWGPVTKDIDLSKRPYFDLLKKGYGENWHGTPILLQRLFDRRDGRKILQLAVARNDEHGVFHGISSVNIGTIEASSPILPLGIGYAIFERSTGTVVFHSDDSRSLVENFYAETERNPTLSSAVKNPSAESILFNGRYRGSNATFVYTPMSYSPWGLAVYYNSSGVSSILALSVVSALAHGVVILLVGLALAQAAIRLVRRRHSWLWPQWRLRNAYPTVCIYLVIISFCQLQMLRHAQGSAWQVVVLLTGPLFVLTACFRSFSAMTSEITARRPRFFRHGLSLVQWSLLLHGVLLTTWVIAAGVAGELLAALILLLAFAAWIFLLDRSVAKVNANPWRRDLNLWPGSAMPAVGRIGYRMRYLLFVVSLTLVVSAVPTLAIFDRTFEWYVSAALNLDREETNEQWYARAQKLREDARLLAESARPDRKTEPKLRKDARPLADSTRLDRKAEPGLSPLEVSRRLGGFGVKLDDAGPYVDGKHLFGVQSPVQCFHPSVAWPLGLWEKEMRWNERILERLRQEAVALEASGPVNTSAAQTERCGVSGTIHELLHTGGDSLISVLWDIVAGLVILALSMLLLNFSARHVMGISLPWSGRFGRQCAPVPCSVAGSGEGAPTVPIHILFLQPNVESLKCVRDRAEARGAIREVDAATDLLGDLEPGGEPMTTWILRRVDIAVLDKDRRVALLALLESLVAKPNTRVVAIGDVSPVYRIARPQAYPGPTWPHIDDYERLRWIDLFTHFYKVYSVDDLNSAFEKNDDGVQVERAPDDSMSWALDELIHRETRALWPCLRPIRRILLDRLHAGADMTDRDVIEFVALHGEVHYRKAWEYCTREERLALYHLAQHRLINMSNQRVIEHLLRRGLVVFEPEPRIKSVSLAEFILNAELPGRMEAWASEAAEGLWQSVRVPIFVALMLVVAWIAYSSGDAFQAVVALVATSVAVIGQALRLLGMAGFSAPTKDK